MTEEEMKSEEKEEAKLEKSCSFYGGVQNEGGG